MGNCLSKPHSLVTGSSEHNRTHREDAANATRSDPVPNLDRPSPEPAGSKASPSNSTSTRKLTEKEIEDLTKCLDHVEEVIDEYRATPLEFLEKLKRRGENLSANNPIRISIDRGSRLLDIIAEKCAEMVKSGGIIISTLQEGKTLVRTSLTALEKVGGFAPGIPVIAFTVSQIWDRFRDMEGNKKGIVKLLEGLVKLCRHLLKLNLHTGFEQVQEAMSLICMAEVWCDKYSQSRTKRFMFVNITRENIENLQEDVDGLNNKLERDYREELLQIVRSVEQQTIPPLLQSFKPPYPDGKVGLQEKVSEVLDKLRVVEGNIDGGPRAILIHGMGGIGKSTLGDAVCAAIPFSQKCAKVEMRENLEKDQICKMQREICQRLFRLNQKIGSCQEGREILKMQFSKCKDPILLFVDNVFNLGDMEDLLPSELDLPQKSRLIVTSRVGRVPDVLRQICDIYEVQTLNEAQGEQVLNNCLRDRQLSEKEKEELSEIRQLCAGLPLALELVGKRLERDLNNDPEALTSVKEDLERGLAKVDNIEKLNGILEWSYKKLRDSAKELFLDICTLLRNEDWAAVECLGTYSDLKYLQEYSLVKKVKEEPSIHGDRLLNSGEVADVHDLLVALAKKESSLTRFGRTDSESFKKLSDENKTLGCEGLVDIPILVDELDALQKSLRILKLESFRNDKDKCKGTPIKLQFCSIRGEYWPGWDLEHFSVFPYADIWGCQQLRVLDIADCFIPDLESVQFPDSLKFLQLQWSGARRNDRQNFHPTALQKCTKLRTLRFSSRGIPPPMFSGLTGIRRLHLRGSAVRETSLYGCGNLAALEELTLFECENLTSLPDSIRGLQSLVFLNVSQCGGLATLPDVFGSLIALRELDLSYCVMLTTLPSSFGRLQSLSSLDMDGCTELAQLPPEFGDLTQLGRLSLNECEKLTTLPGSFSRLRSLSYLDMDCSGLVELPPDIGDLAQLRELSLYGCEKLTSLPNSFSLLQSLSYLDMRNCSGLAELPLAFGDLTQLRELFLNGCKKLTSLPNSFSRLQSLSYLNMAHCSGLAELPLAFGDLTQLRELILYRCHKLTSLPNSFSRLRSLSYLHMDCSGLVELPPDIGDLAQLRELSLYGCEKLTSLSNSFGHLQSLSHLNMRNCRGLAELPLAFGDLTQLRELSLEWCEKLTSLSNSFGHLQSLSKLYMIYCTELAELPAAFGDLTQLQELSLDGCEKLTSLPSSFGHLQSLSNLDMTNCSGLAELPLAFGDLTQLRELILCRCHKLTSLPNSFSRLQSLSKLYMTNCSGLAELPLAFGDLTQLRELSLNGCEKLTSLPSSFSRLQSLSNLDMTNCTGLTELPPAFGDLTGLQELSLDGCEKLTSLPSSFSRLHSLSNLDMKIVLDS